MDQNKKIVFTGDRPTGRLHLGHYVGSIVSRVELQEKYKQYVMIADVQALTDNFDNPAKVRNSVPEIAIDYLSVGIDPAKTTIFIQSQVPEIAELTLYLLNLVTLARLKRNPTVKDEMKQKGFGEDVPAGFLTYPINQAADILAFKANAVPVGKDQLPMLEQANEIAHKFNSIYGKVFEKIYPIISRAPRLAGIDGKAKMSKSLGNAIYLSDTPEEIEHKVMSMYTDPNHVHVSDPGEVRGNIVFEYLDAFDNNKEELEELKGRYERGGLGDVEIKKRLIGILYELLTPIREKREHLEKDPKYVMEILKEGTKESRRVAQKTLAEVRAAMQLQYF
ncbi:MAG: tryptophan--tRNA ligase [Patescibacteria group bacterium]|nr:MAG: tryptophan--tRNA ligase [Patescibacteria group bacterium]